MSTIEEAFTVALEELRAAEIAYGTAGVHTSKKSFPMTIQSNITFAGAQCENHSGFCQP